MGRPGSTAYTSRENKQGSPQGKAGNFSVSCIFIIRLQAPNSWHFRHIHIHKELLLKSNKVQNISDFTYLQCSMSSHADQVYHLLFQEKRIY